MPQESPTDNFEASRLVPDLELDASWSPPVCFIIDDEPAIQNLIATAISSFGALIERFDNANDALKAVPKLNPKLIFLDLSLKGSDAVEVIRGLSSLHFKGIVQLVSGQNAGLLKDLQLIGLRHAITMLPPLQKPFRVDAVRTITREVFSDTLRAEPTASHASAKQPQQKVDLGEVIANDWLQLWYQPKIDIQHMKPVGAEGLVRCIHPKHGLLLPGAFLPGAKPQDMVAMTERILMRALSDWPLFTAGGFPLKLSLNVSVDLLSAIPVAQIVREYGPKRDDWPGLILEITEDQAVRDFALMHEIAVQLRLYNISIAIDDFGTGYSHLARLKDFPFAELKLDRSLVMNCENAETNALCRMAIDLAHKFGAVAVAEGIEKVEEVRALREMGCDIGQGFLFAPAVPRDKLLNAMQRRQGELAKKSENATA